MKTLLTIVLVTQVLAWWLVSHQDFMLTETRRLLNTANAQIQIQADAAHRPHTNNFPRLNGAQ